VDPAGTELIRVGQIAGAYGVRGWLRVRSDTDPAIGILNYRPWRLRVAADWIEVEALEGRPHQNGLVVKLGGCDDRDAAGRLSGAEIAVTRDQLPALGEVDYYWVDLIGAEVVNVDGTPFGRVSHLMHTGANDVLVVQGERERLIPFIEGQVVLEVEVGGGRITVDWDPEF
jgi:16S rRNA processing protein RimM